MTINQAFEKISMVSDRHIARIIIENTPKISHFKLWKIVRQLKKNVPVAKIIHKKWFYGLEFYTNKNTLDPRPDTETLIESVLSDKPQSPTILDLGTGTGCIICSLVKNIDSATGVAVDVSNGALKVAKRNIKNLGLTNKIKTIRANFTHKNILSDKFDIIVSNPPYIARGDARVDMYAKHDPKIALYAKNNGLYAYEKIAQNATQWLKPNGKIYLEIGAGMMTQVKKIFISNGWKFVRADKDLGGKYRVVVFNRNA